MVTSRFIRLNNWDRTTINLPFGRGALVGIKEIHVPSDADATTMERLRQEVEDTLNEANRIAYAMVGRPDANGEMARQEARQVAPQEAQHG